MRVLVTGATGFVGGNLTHELVERGHDVRAMTRAPERYRGPGSPVGGDAVTGAGLADALRDRDVAFYLVHSLAEGDFAERDRTAARAFAGAAVAAGVGQVVYLGGLGDDRDDLSAHLRSRREVERILLAEAPTTALRAGIVIGDGGISWEILRQLVERLPVMVTPRWVQTRTQPVGIDDALDALISVAGRADTVGNTFDVGGADVLTYRQMLETVASITHRPRLILPVPLLSPRLSSHWLNLVTDVDMATARTLVDSLTNEVVVRDHRIAAVVTEATGAYEPMSFRAAAIAALDARADRMRGGVPAHVAP